MRRLHPISEIAALCAAVVAAGCTTAATNVSPKITFQSSNGVLQMSVGTVNFAGMAAGLNVLETFRSPSGFTAIPVNTATLSGPPGFVGPAGSKDPGAGLTAVPMGAAGNLFQEGPVFTDLAAADGFGVGPPGTSSTATNPFPVQPQFFDAVAGAGATFGTTGQFPQYGAPPAYPASGGTPLSSGAIVWPEGFYLLALAGPPPTGAYTLTVNYSQNGVAASSTAKPTLASATLLPTFAMPAYAPDGAGGGTVTVTLPAGVTEAIVNLTDASTGSSFASLVFHSNGSQTVPDGTFTAMDTIAVQAFGFNYNDFELGPNMNTQQTPALPAQANVTVSVQNAVTQTGVARHPLSRHR